MTNKEKKKENEVFRQEVSKEELTAVNGGECGKSAFIHGPCPKGVQIIELCRENANQFFPTTCRRNLPIPMIFPSRN